LTNSLQPPSLSHFFGTDALGRDVFSRTLHGIRISVLAGLGVVGCALVVGTFVGLVSGYSKGLPGEVLMRLADMFIAFPTLIMAMAIVALLGATLANAMLSIALIWWPQYARLVRGQVLQEMAKEYPTAASALGASGPRIVLRHVLPSCASPLLVRASLDLGTALLLTASLSFLGLGAQPPSPELGATITHARDFLLTAWWYPTFPGLALFLCVLTASMVGDVVHDVLDPTISSKRDIQIR
jgi:peptide/nickel transport system permease protein